VVKRQQWRHTSGRNAELFFKEDPWNGQAGGPEHQHRKEMQ
jgi:hypothetical protein